MNTTDLHIDLGISEDNGGSSIYSKETFILSCSIFVLALLALPTLMLKYQWCSSCADFIASFFDDDAESVDGEGVTKKAGLFGITAEERKLLLEEILHVEIYQINNPKIKQRKSKTEKKTGDVILNINDASIHSIKEEDEVSLATTNFADTDELCIICLSDYVDGEEIVCSQKCSHLFHKSCLLEWLGEDDHNDCPVCRKTMIMPDEMKEAASRCIPADRLEELEKGNSINDIVSDDGSVDNRNHVFLQHHHPMT